MSMIVPRQGANDDAEIQLCRQSMDWVSAAFSVDLKSVADRTRGSPRFPEVWPGEHYRLLAGMVKSLKPNRIVEFGTLTGLSALAMLKYLGAEGRVTTFDILPWRSFGNSCLSEGDFEDGRLVQVVADVGDRASFETHKALLMEADMILIDGPKDGIFEPRLLEHLSSLPFRDAPVVVLDDIRFWNMVPIWEGIAAPKIDLTSYGHWSGTGVVRWVSGAKPANGKGV